MEKENSYSGEIPAYLAGSLDEKRADEVRDAIRQSQELQEDLRFWMKMRSLVKAEALYETAGHLPKEAIVDFVENRTLNPATIDAHLAACPACREDLDTIRGTYPAASVKQRRSLLQTILELFLNPPRIGYTLAALTIIAILATLARISFVNQPPQWKQLRAEGERLSEQGNDDLAADFYREALGAATIRTRDDAEGVATILDSLAVIHLRADNPSEAELFLRRSLAIREESRLDRTLHAAWTLDRLGDIMKSTAHEAEAEALYRRADRVRENLARDYPEDTNLQGYLPNVAQISIAPQIGVRGPGSTRIPTIDLDDQTTHLRFHIRLRSNRNPEAAFIPNLSTPSRKTIPLPDTLFADPLHPQERTVMLTLSRRFFSEGEGMYRIGIREMSRQEAGIEDVYYFRLLRND